MYIKSTKYGHLALVPAKNELVAIIDSVDIENTDRSGLRYFLEILVQKAPQSTEYVVFRTLSGKEKPSVSEGGAVYYPGFQPFVDEYLNGMLSYTPPALDKVIPQQNAVKAYKLRSWAERDGVEVVDSEVISEVKYAIKAALGEEDFPNYKEAFFTSYMDEKMPFLTHQPNGMAVSKTMPVCLSWLCNISPVPVTVRMVANVRCLNADSRYVLMDAVAGVQNTVFNWLCGYERVKEFDGSFDSDYRFYDVFLVDEENKIVSEVRRFYVDHHYFESERHFVFNNSLGGFDAIRATGGGAETVNVSTELKERPTGANDTMSDGNVLVVSKEGERGLVINTGSQTDPEWLDYLEELVWAEQIYIVENELKPLVLKTNSYAKRADGEDIGSRVFEFVKSKNARATNKLPYRAGASARPTVWLPTGSYCMVGADGKQTGYSGASKLEQYYSDASPYEKVPGVALKENIEGTEGYVAPVLNAGCVVGYAANYNDAISKQGNYKKQGCGVGYAGTTALISVAAGLFGGATIKEANDLADAEWKRRNTQAAANANADGCVLAPEGYTVSVTSGKAHFRWNAFRVGSAYADNNVQKTSTAGVSKGNGWSFWSDGVADVFLPGTNDIELPVAFATDRPWKFVTYGKGSGSTTCTIYVNAVQVATMSSAEGYFVIEVAHAAIPDGAKVYVKVE